MTTTQQLSFSDISNTTSSFNSNSFDKQQKTNDIPLFTSNTPTTTTTITTEAPATEFNGSSDKYSAFRAFHLEVPNEQNPSMDQNTSTDPNHDKYSAFKEVLNIKRQIIFFF